MMYGSTIESLTCSLVYHLLRYGQGKGLIQCHKPLETVMLGLFNICFRTKV